MSKTKEVNLRKKPVRPQGPPADGLTVGWVLTLITTIFCLFVASSARAFVWFVQPEASMIEALSGLMLFSAAVISVILVVLTPIIVRRKKSNPPRGLVYFAYVVAVTPWISMLLQGWE